MAVWLLFSLCVSTAVYCDPIEFDPFFSQGTSFFSPPADAGFGTFSAQPFRHHGGGSLASNFDTKFAAETSNIPVYTDGVATQPQITLSQLEKGYKAQLQRLANARPGIHQPTLRSQIRLGPQSYQSRSPVYLTEPFPSASNIEERKPALGQRLGYKTTEGPRSPSLPKIQPVELQTGFVPIIKGANKDTRLTKNIASTVIKDIEPPILTAPSTPLTSRPNLFKVSASVLSSSKVPASSQQRQNASLPTPVGRGKARSPSFSRFLNHTGDAKSFSVSSSSSESVVSQVVTRSESVQDAQQRDLQRLNSQVTEESKLDAKRTLDINCDGSKDLGWCELGDKYPKKYVDQVIASCQDVVDRMHVEVPHSFEKLSETSNFKAELDNSSQRAAKERGSHDAWSWAAYFHQGSLCDAETGFLRPETAKDSSGIWNIIVQTDVLKQRVPIEMCRKINGSCKKMVNCGLKSQCLQKYNYHLLMSLNPLQKHDCPTMKLYRFPSACVCHVE